MHGALTSLVSPDFQFLRPISRSPAVICSEIACAPPSYLVQALGVINEHRTSTRKWTCGRRECDHVLFQIESDARYYLFRKSYPRRFRLIATPGYGGSEFSSFPFSYTFWRTLNCLYANKHPLVKSLALCDILISRVKLHIPGPTKLLCPHINFFG